MAIIFGPKAQTKVAASKPREARPRAERLLKPSAKVGRPRIEESGKTIEAQAPWLALGMSRRTWYRRKREAKTDG